MKYVDRIRTDLSLWLLILIGGGIIAAFLYVVATSITV
jgi:hypothetical protein